MAVEKAAEGRQRLSGKAQQSAPLIIAHISHFWLLLAWGWSHPISAAVLGLMMSSRVNGLTRGCLLILGSPLTAHVQHCRRSRIS